MVIFHSYVKLPEGTLNCDLMRNARKAIQCLLQAISRGWSRNPAPVGGRIPIISQEIVQESQEFPKCIPLESQKIQPVFQAVYILYRYIDI